MNEDNDAFMIVNTLINMFEDGQPTFTIEYKKKGEEGEHKLRVTIEEEL